MMPEMIREGRGRYRIGDFSIVQETRRCWRIWWMPLKEEYDAHAGLPCVGLLTLREARKHVEAEIEFETKAAASGNTEPVSPL